MIGKRLQDWTVTDIETLIREEVQEDDGIEFKVDLPSKSGRRSDPWWADGDVGPRARDKIIEEVIAFANGYGGTVIIGVAETDTKPASAASIEPLPRCGELAERFKMFCRDCIEPRPAIIQVASILTDTDGSGVIAIHAPKSLTGPHRHTSTKECYIRRADSSEKMTMREIRDLTLQLDLGIRGVEQRFKERRGQFEQHRAGTWENNLFAFRATLIPVSPIRVDRVHGDPNYQPPLLNLSARLDSSNNSLNIRPPMGDSGKRWRTLIRGSQNIEDYGDHIMEREVYCDGLIEYRYRSSPAYENDRSNPLFSDWITAILANSLIAAESFRRSAGAVDAEYGLECEIACEGKFSFLRPGQRQRDSFEFDETFLPVGQDLFPRYSVGPIEEFGQVAFEFQRDLLDHVGLATALPCRLDFGPSLIKFQLK